MTHRDDSTAGDDPVAGDPEAAALDVTALDVAALDVVAKARILGIVRDQPDDSSYDEILRELAFDRMIQRGLRDIDAGRTVDESEIRRRLRRWHGDGS